MKVQYKKKYRPVTVTLENKEEYASFMMLLSASREEFASIENNCDTPSRYAERANFDTTCNMYHDLVEEENNNSNGI